MGKKNSIFLLDNLFFKGRSITEAILIQFKTHNIPCLTHKKVSNGQVGLSNFSDLPNNLINLWKKNHTLIKKDFSARLSISEKFHLHAYTLVNWFFLPTREFHLQTWKKSYTILNILENLPPKRLHESKRLLGRSE